jgi:hypothetical protein
MIQNAFRKPPGNSINFEEGYEITFRAILKRVSEIF